MTSSTSSNRYLALVPARTPMAASTVARVMLPVSAATAAISTAVAMLAPAVVPIALAAGSAAALFGTLAWLVRTRRRAVREILDAADDVLSESFDDASEHVRRALATRLDHLHRGETLALLARCASMRGDLADAAQLHALALNSLGTRRLARHLDAIHLISQIRPQRAFALLATGDIEGAEKLLALPVLANAHPAAAALTTRAKALLHWRRAEREPLLALLLHERSRIHTFLTVRDRTFLHVLEARARDVQGDARIPVEADVARWIERIAPDLAPAMVVA